MKRNLIIFRLLIATVTLVFFISCNVKEEVVFQKVIFSFENKQTVNPSDMHRINAVKKTDAKFLIITIENEKGEKIYDTKKIELYTFNESIISESISLNVADNKHKLTQFLVLDADNNVIYFTPVEKSNSAKLVNNPLPISFVVDKNEITKIVPEVISSDAADESDYGYGTFDFDVINTIKLKTCVQIIDSTTNNRILTNAKIFITTNDTIVHYSDSIDAVVSNLRLKDEFSSYTVFASKTGYETQRIELTNAEIKNFENNPLTLFLPIRKQSISTMALIAKKIGTNLTYQFKLGTNYVTDLKINSIMIFDTQGNLKMTVNKGINQPFSIASLPSGYYVLQVDVADSAVFSKLFLK